MLDARLLPRPAFPPDDRVLAMAAGAPGAASAGDTYRRRAVPSISGCWAAWKPHMTLRRATVVAFSLVESSGRPGAKSEGGVERLKAVIAPLTCGLCYFSCHCAGRAPQHTLRCHLLVRGLHSDTLMSTNRPPNALADSRISLLWEG